MTRIAERLNAAGERLPARDEQLARSIAVQAFPFDHRPLDLPREHCRQRRSTYCRAESSDQITSRSQTTSCKPQPECRAPSATGNAADVERLVKSIDAIAAVSTQIESVSWAGETLQLEGFGKLGREIADALRKGNPAARTEPC
jgi:hypothetical protein